MIKKKTAKRWAFLCLIALLGSLMAYTMPMTETYAEVSTATSASVPVQGAYSIHAYVSEAMFGCAVKVTVDGLNDAVKFQVLIGGTAASPIAAIGTATTVFPANKPGDQVGVKLFNAQGVEIITQVVTLVSQSSATPTSTPKPTITPTPTPKPSATSTPLPVISFKDVSSSSWYYNTVNFLVSKGIINGYPNGTFQPDGNVNVDAFIKMVVTSMGYTGITNGSSYWASTYIDKAKSLGLVVDNEFVTYNRAITRGEMARIMARQLVARGETFPANMNNNIQLIKDYSKIKSGFGDYVLKAFSKGIITGYPDGEFKDTQNAKRSEAATMIARVIDEAQRRLPGTY